jgi:predicted ferric reductase
VALKFFALASGGDEVTLGLGYVFGGAAALAVTLAAALAMTAAVIDWFAADRRDAFHWAGVLALVIALAHGLTLLAMGLAV